MLKTLKNWLTGAKPAAPYETFDYAKENELVKKYIAADQEQHKAERFASKQLTLALPEFGSNRSCSKCGGSGFSLHYQPASFKSVYATNYRHGPICYESERITTDCIEAIIRQCNHCGATVKERPQDVKVTEWQP